MKKLILIILFLLSSSLAYGAGTCWNGGSAGTSPWSVLDGEGGDPSCAEADVIYCVETVASEGETVNVGAGTCPWTGDRTDPINGNYECQLSVSKGLTLVGGNGGTTTITHDGANKEAVMISVGFSDYSAEHTVEISNFTFDSKGGLTIALGRKGATFSVPFAIQTAKIHDNTFNDSTNSNIKGAAIWNNGTFWGVVYENTFDHYYPVANSFGTMGTNDSLWANFPQNTFVLGSDDALYYEDNTFTIGSPSSTTSVVMNGEYAPRYVARYNTIIDPHYGGSAFDFHGEQSAMDGGFFVEIYGNDYTQGATGNNTNFHHQRSGRNKVFLNNINTTNSRYGYFGIDNSASICPPAYAEEKMFNDSHYFRNRMNYTGNTMQMSVSATKIDDCAGLDGWPTDGRDVFDDDSSPGIGCGSSLPGTCTEKETYWLTDQTQSCTNLSNYVGRNPTIPIVGVLYICGASNDWSVNYTPYAYPHPLRDDARVTPVLSVVKVGNGSITSAPAGIDCGATCWYEYAQDTEITLTATADPGYDAATYSGDCAADGTVTVSTDKTCIVTFNRTDGGAVGTGASFKLGVGSSFKLY